MTAAQACVLAAQATKTPYTVAWESPPGTDGGLPSVLRRAGSFGLNRDGAYETYRYDWSRVLPVQLSEPFVTWTRCGASGVDACRSGNGPLCLACNPLQGASCYCGHSEIGISDIVITCPWGGFSTPDGG